MEAHRRKAKVLVVGDTGVGKRSLIRRSTVDPYADAYIDTLGAKVSKKEVVLPIRLRDGTYLDLILWTISGDVPFRFTRGAGFFKQAQGILAVCEAGRRSTLDHLYSWIEHAFSVSGRIPVVVAVNKSDLPIAEVTETLMRPLGEAYDAAVYRTSAKTGANVEACLQAFAEHVAERLIERDREAAGRAAARSRRL